MGLIMPYIYFVQPAILVSTDQYKIGMSTLNNPSRLKSYQRGTRVLCALDCDDPIRIETIKTFIEAIIV